MLRQEGLTSLTQHYLEEAIGLGFSAKEVKAAFESQVDALASGKDPPAGGVDFPSENMDDHQNT